jgi:hypothetical protein
MTTNSTWAALRNPAFRKLLDCRGGPLIFTLPASSFVVILSFDWLDGTDRAAVSAKRTVETNLANRPITAKEVVGSRVLPALVQQLGRTPNATSGVAQLS